LLLDSSKISAHHNLLTSVLYIVAPLENTKIHSQSLNLLLHFHIV